MNTSVKVHLSLKDFDPKGAASSVYLGKKRMILQKISRSRYTSTHVKLDIFFENQVHLEVSSSGRRRKTEQQQKSRTIREKEKEGKSSLVEGYHLKREKEAEVCFS